MKPLHFPRLARMTRRSRALSAAISRVCSETFVFQAIAAIEHLVPPFSSPMETLLFWGQDDIDGCVLCTYNRSIEFEKGKRVATQTLPCPFCGSTRIGCHLRKSGRKSGYQCMCLNCGIRQSGSFHPDIVQAIVVWNKRVTTDAVNT